MIQCAKIMNAKLDPVRDILGRAHCFALLASRLYVANIFFKSGMLKLNDIRHGRFDEVVTAFTDIHPIPGIAPVIAAIAGQYPQNPPALRFIGVGEGLEDLRPFDAHEFVGALFD